MSQGGLDRPPPSECPLSARRVASQPRRGATAESRRLRAGPQKLRGMPRSIGRDLSLHEETDGPNDRHPDNRQSEHSSRAPPPVPKPPLAASGTCAGTGDRVMYRPPRRPPLSASAPR